MKQFYTVREIADLLAVSKTTIQKAIKANSITYQKIERNKQLYTIEQSNAIIRAVKADFPLLETENSTTETENSTTKSENKTDNSQAQTENSPTKTENSTTKSENQVENSTTTADHIGRMLDFIEKQAQEKDKIIESLQKELAEARAESARKDEFIREQGERLAILLEQSQKLQAGAQMLLLTDKTVETTHESIDEKKPQKQGFFKKLFKK